MKKRVLLACLTAIALVLTLAFSASADVILPPDQEVFESTVYEQETAGVVQSDNDGIERIDISDEIASMIAEENTAAAEDETVILYGSAEVPPDHTLPDVDVEAVEAENGSSIVKPILICLVIGAVIALVVVLAVKSSYKPVHRKRDAAEYLVDGSLNVTAADEKFTRSERSERKIQTKDSDK